MTVDNLIDTIKKKNIRIYKEGKEKSKNEKRCKPCGSTHTHTHTSRLLDNISIAWNIAFFVEQLNRIKINSLDGHVDSMPI